MRRLSDQVPHMRRCDRNSYQWKQRIVRRLHHPAAHGAWSPRCSGPAIQRNRGNTSFAPHEQRLRTWISEALEPGSNANLDDLDSDGLQAYLRTRYLNSLQCRRVENSTEMGSQTTDEAQ